MPALEKIKDWCAYQERSQHEVRQKLYKFGLHQNEVEELIAHLISENFINEQRFALAFAGGKFRIKGWGRIKIKKELRNHRVSEPCLQKALDAITEKDYLAMLEKTASRKALSLGPVSEKQKTASLYRFMLSKGFEPSLILSQLKKLKLNTDELGIEE